MQNKVGVVLSYNLLLIIPSCKNEVNKLLVLVSSSASCTPRWRFLFSPALPVWFIHHTAAVAGGHQMHFWSTARLALPCEEAAPRLGPCIPVEGAGWEQRLPVCTATPATSRLQFLPFILVKHPLISTSQSRTRGFQKSHSCVRAYTGAQLHQVWLNPTSKEVIAMSVQGTTPQMKGQI